MTARAQHFYLENRSGVCIRVHKKKKGLKVPYLSSKLGLQVWLTWPCRILCIHTFTCSVWEYSQLIMCLLQILLCRVPTGPVTPLPTSPPLPTAASPRTAEILWAGDGLVLGSWFWGEEEAASTRCPLRAVWLWAGQHWVKAFWDTSHIQNNQILPDLYASNP